MFVKAISRLCLFCWMFIFEMQSLTYAASSSSSFSDKLHHEGLYKREEVVWHAVLSGSRHRFGKSVAAVSIVNAQNPAALCSALIFACGFCGRNTSLTPRC